MVTIVFCTRDDAAALGRSLVPLVHEAVEGHISEVVVIDAGSSDATRDIADGSGCRLVEAGKGTLRTVIETARADWLVFMEPGARLAPGWADAVMEHLMRPEASAARFTLKTGGNWWSRVFRPALVRQRPLSLGLLISRSQALANIGPDAATGADLVRGRSLRVLDAAIEPAR